MKRQLFIFEAALYCDECGKVVLHLPSQKMELRRYPGARAIDLHYGGRLTVDPTKGLECPHCKEQTWTPRKSRVRISMN